MQPQLYTLAPTSERDAAFSAIQNTYASELTCLEDLLPQAKRFGVNGSYICLGCQVGNGETRRRLLEFALYPLLEQVAEHRFGRFFSMFAYHPQAYEEGADSGPGGVIGVQLISKGRAAPGPNISAATALKMWLWISPKTNYPYLPEEQAREDLWNLTQERCAKGLAFLKQLNDPEPQQPVAYPRELQHQLHTLLGVPAICNLVEANLGLRMLLVNRNCSSEGSIWHGITPCCKC